MISKETAADIAFAYRELEVGEELLKKIEEAKSRGEPPDFRDAFGRRRSGITLGWPTGDTAKTLFDVPMSIAPAVVRAHLAEMRSKLMALNELALIEAKTPVLAAPPPEAIG